MDPSCSASSASVCYTIGGVKVEFPARAYPSQISMMDKVIRGCHKAQNCLLESPTGSGKTLALLCAAAAWQKAETKRLAALSEVEHQQYYHQLYLAEQEHKKQQEVQKRLEQKNETVQDSESTPKSSHEKMRTPEIVKEEENEDSDEDLFLPPSKRKRVINSPYFQDSSSVDSGYETKVSTPETPRVVFVDSANSEKCSGSASTSTPNMIPIEDQIRKPKKHRTPKIYFGTRTHKQISQVVQELRKTVYSDLRSCVLSSRTHSCIHEMPLNKFASKTEMCRQLLEPHSGMSCRFHRNVKNYSSFEALKNYNFPAVWDIEDMIKFGKKVTTCPYFTARELMLSANIIFCPYNYLVDPLIRKSMNIRLKGEILILDEAHNIEDTCRDAASFTVTQHDISLAMQDCEQVFEFVKDDNDSRCSYRFVTDYLASLSHWIDEHKNDVNDCPDYDQGKLTMTGLQAVESFEKYKIGPSTFEKFRAHLAVIDAQRQIPTNPETGEKEYLEETIKATTKAILDGLELVFEFLFSNEYKNDYHVAIIKKLSHKYTEAPEPDSDGWFNLNKKSKSQQRTRWLYELSFWCLNPAAVFSEIKKNVRSIILTSGTLSPIESFQSELGAQFPITLEANHVIENSQCWIGSIGVGPNHVSLDGKYANTNTFQFQDELGTVMLHLCSFIPNGVLCFVPSYILLDKLYDRWATTGTLNEICRHKIVLCEPRRGDEFDDLMKKFYATIESTANAQEGDISGVLLLAVCRGKVSEGIDFADKNARIVITVGIPFPNVKNSQVMLKKSYNDRYKQIRGLLSGNDWYQIQAYRALNQALGRCIRHRKDWGAILLVDQRFSNQHYYSGLSKWVRTKMLLDFKFGIVAFTFVDGSTKILDIKQIRKKCARHHFEYKNMMTELTSFMKARLRIDSEGWLEILSWNKICVKCPQSEIKLKDYSY